MNFLLLFVLFINLCFSCFIFFKCQDIHDDILDLFIEISRRKGKR